MTELEGWAVALIVALLIMIAEVVGVPNASIRWVCLVFAGALFGIWMHT